MGTMQKNNKSVILEQPCKKKLDTCRNDNFLGVTSSISPTSHATQQVYRECIYSIIGMFVLHCVRNWNKLNICEQKPLQKEIVVKIITWSVE